jgi:peptidoglycan/LPS O-acetylase OafA/YrhL
MNAPDTLSPSLSRIPALDTLRGLASLSVCLLHLTNYDPAILPPDDLGKIACSFGSLGVQIFFVISGFIIPYSMYRAGYQSQNKGRFLAKRLLRLEPPYLASLALALVAHSVRGERPSTPGAFRVSQRVFRLSLVESGRLDFGD